MDIKYGSWHFNFQREPVFSIVEKACADLSKEFSKANIELKKIYNTKAQITVDIYSITFAIKAILSNAIVSGNDKNEVSIIVSEKNDQVLIQCIDHGKGFKAEYLNHATEVFTDSSVISHSVGHGLSLAICSEILQKHYGSISIANNSQTGACVTLALPAA